MNILPAPCFVTVTKQGAGRQGRGGFRTGSWSLLSVDIRCDVLPPYLRYRRVFANLSEVPPVALFR